MLMYNLKECSDNYSKTSGSLWQYCTNKPTANNHGAIIAFDAVDVTDSFNFKGKLTSQTAIRK